MEKIRSNPALLSFGLIAILSLIWGSSFILIKKSLVAFDWTQVAALRIGITMLWFLPFVYQQIRKVRDRKTYIAIFVMALFGNGIPAFLFPIAQTQIDSSLAGILNSCTPIAVMITGAIIFNVVPSRNKIFGVLMGILGAILLIAFSPSNGTGDNNWYGLFILLAAFCYGISSNTIKEYLQNLKALTSTSIAFLFIGPFAVMYLFSTDFMTIMETDENAWMSFASVGILATFGTALATLLFVKLVQVTSAVFSAMITYLIPVVAIFFGFLDGEVISLWHGLGIVLILSGVYLAKEKEKKLKD